MKGRMDALIHHLAKAFGISVSGEKVTPGLIRDLNRIANELVPHELAHRVEIVVGIHETTKQAMIGWRERPYLEEAKRIENHLKAAGLPNPRVEPFTGPIPGQRQIMTMPLAKNIKMPPRAGWELKQCPTCGQDCYEQDLHRLTKQQFPQIEAACTECALKAGAGK